MQFGNFLVLFHVIILAVELRKTSNHIPVFHQILFSITRCDVQQAAYLWTALGPTCRPRRCSCHSPSNMRPAAFKRYKEVCLVDSFRAHRYKVQYNLEQQLEMLRMWEENISGFIQWIEQEQMRLRRELGSLTPLPRTPFRL